MATGVVTETTVVPSVVVFPDSVEEDSVVESWATATARKPRRIVGHLILV